MRPIIFMAVIPILATTILLLVPAEETTIDFRKFGPAGAIVLMLMSLGGYAILGSWIGWGVAHWRFKVRPEGTWPFWTWPAITGAFLYGGMMCGLMLSITSVGNEIMTGPEKVAGVIFAVVVGPFFGLIGAAFFRYILSFTALGSGR